MASCVICMDDENKDTFYTIPECNHNFHTNCIMSWFRSGKKTCPCCKSEETSIEIPAHRYKRKFLFLQKLATMKSANVPAAIADMIRECANRVNKQDEMYRDLRKYAQKAKGDYSNIRKKILRKTKKYEKYCDYTKECMKEIATCNIDQIIIPIRKVYY